MSYANKILHPYTPREELGFEVPPAKHRRRDEGSRSFRARVLERDGNQCQHCHLSKREWLTAHHLCMRARAWDHPNLNDTRNGVTLCRTCHTLLHEDQLGIEAEDKWLLGSAYLDNLPT